MNNFNKPPRVIKPGGNIHPVMRPLSIVQHFHPDKKDIHEYMIELGATREYDDSIKLESPNKILSKLPSRHSSVKKYKESDYIRSTWMY